MVRRDPAADRDTDGGCAIAASVAIRLPGTWRGRDMIGWVFRTAAL